jgi:AcrR family transcriptional regulator
MAAEDLRVPDAYHHGDLPNALKHAAAALIAERGLGAFSLREVARRAGVSHAAPAHHFGDVTGLLTALAIDAFEYLEVTCGAAAAAEPDPVERFVAVARTYVEAGRTHPGHCAVMFRVDLVDAESPAYVAAGMRSFAVLEETVRALAPDVDPLPAALLAWCSMQGLLELAPKIAQLQAARGEPDQVLADRAEELARLLVRGLHA